MSPNVPTRSWASSASTVVFVGHISPHTFVPFGRSIALLLCARYRGFRCVVLGGGLVDVGIGMCSRSAWPGSRQFDSWMPTSLTVCLFLLGGLPPLPSDLNRQSLTSGSDSYKEIK